MGARACRRRPAAPAPAAPRPRAGAGVGAVASLFPLPPPRFFVPGEPLVSPPAVPSPCLLNGARRGCGPLRWGPAFLLLLSPPGPTAVFAVRAPPRVRVPPAQPGAGGGRPRTKPPLLWLRGGSATRRSPLSCPPLGPRPLAPPSRALLGTVYIGSSRQGGSWGVWGVRGQRPPRLHPESLGDLRLPIPPTFVCFLFSFLFFFFFF